ncbi:lipocalin-like domain-containing protein [Lutimonas sp.]|uniref:lipocalin-like domain-containing protein n=1 Tax=Lutimonas sp. TaxID=1872403 RepID=UPI003D9AF4AF
MRTFSIVLTFLGLLLFFSCKEKKKESEEDGFRGLWTLVSMEQLNSETDQWEEWRSGMQGYILYDGTNNMSLHLTTRGYEKTAIRFPNFTDTIPEDALKHLTNSYVYVAKYKVDTEQGTVEHARISHSNPGDWNKVVKRNYTFKGDTLILKPVESANSNLRLTWIKDKR